MMLLATKGPFRDARGRFRRKTREDMSDFERINFDMLRRLAASFAESVTQPNPLFEKLRILGGEIGTSYTIRLPSDYKFLDTVKLVD